MNIFDLVTKIVIVSLVGLLATIAFRRGSASTRHTILAMTLLALCALPLVSPLLPQWHVPFLKREVAAAPTEILSAMMISGTVQPAPKFNAESLAVGVWMGVATLLLVRLGVSLSRLKRLENGLQMSDDSGLQRAVAEICRQSGKRVLLLEGSPNEPPMTWGFSRPVLLLPSDSSSWPTERLRSVILHELAHIERGDWLVSLFSQITCAVLWFNPVVWFIAKRIEWESEAAADDRVLALGVSGTQYATHLLDLLRDLSGVKSSSQAALAMARPGKLDGRVRAILEERRCRQNAGSALLFGLVAVAIGIVAAVGMATPTFVRVALNQKPKVSVSVDSGPGDHAEMREHPRTDSGIQSPERAEAQVAEVEAKQAQKEASFKDNMPKKKGSHAPVSFGEVSSDLREGGSVALTAGSQNMLISGGNVVRETPNGKGVAQSGSSAERSDPDDHMIDPDTAKDKSEAVNEVKKGLVEANDEIQKSLADAQKEIDKAGLNLNVKKFVEQTNKNVALGGANLIPKIDLVQIEKAAKEAAVAGLAHAPSQPQMKVPVPVVRPPTKGH